MWGGFIVSGGKSEDKFDVHEIFRGGGLRLRLRGHFRRGGKTRKESSVKNQTIVRT